MEVLTSSISRMARTWIILEVPFIGAREIKLSGINVSSSDANLYRLPGKQSRNWSLLCECTSVKFVQREAPVNTEVQKQNGKVVGEGGCCAEPVILYATWSSLQLRDFMPRVLSTRLSRFCNS